ncbi:MAG TPA: class I SAM-dependent methyltransferase [Bacteroidales bacterium]|nr:class I SAM-dependent methyltransferase [Bacteroidales bacterium]
MDDSLDIKNMYIYDDNAFDFIICSHVLEHIVEDLQAIGELYRVLKPGGKSIIMAPIFLHLKDDYENPKIFAPYEKWKHFGQDDHVRIYSKEGFKRKLQASGFKTKEYSINDFGIENFHMAGIHKQSVLYVAEKEMIAGDHFYQLPMTNYQ